MKPSPQAKTAPLLVFGAHPDDIEFGCGGIVARETRAGRAAHFVVCSRGEAGTNGTPQQRVAEAERAAKILGATLEFLELDGDAHLELRSAHAIKLARILRRVRPAVVLAPTVEPNQHPDHWRLGQLVRDACRVARFGGVGELRQLAPHAIARLFFYAVTPDAEPPGALPVLIDISPPAIVKTWTAAMAAHASQMKTRDYIEFQLARAKVHGLGAGRKYAQPLFPNAPLVFESATF
ncbi:MAG TPA: PIG-L family deacetylase [Opitutales bacterium]|nr:PIG-L family deacetylase [Opitutales bacterium]